MSMYDLEKVYLELLLAQAQAQAQNQNPGQGAAEQGSNIPFQQQHQHQSQHPSSQPNLFSQGEAQVQTQAQTQTQALSSLFSHTLPHFGGQSQTQASPQTRSLGFSHLFSQPQATAEPQPLSLAQLFSQSQSQQAQKQQAQQQQQQQQHQQQHQQQQPLTSLSDFFSQSQSQPSPRGESQRPQSQTQQGQGNPPNSNTLFNWPITQHQLSLQSQNTFPSTQSQLESSFLQLPNLNSGTGLSLTSRHDHEDVSEPSTLPQLFRSAQDSSRMPFSNDWLSSIKFGPGVGSTVQASHEDVSEQISQQTASTVATASMGEGTSGDGMQAEPGKSSRYESQKRRDWNTFGQYLKNHRPPITMNRCTSQHVVEFLRYLDQFGKTKVHNEGCQFYGTSGGNPCGCPMKQAWGSLDSLVGRLRAAYEENGGKSENNPFGTRIVRTFLRDVREHQAKARGIAYEKKKRKRTGAALVGMGGNPAATSGGPGTNSGGLGKIIQGNFKEM